MAVAARRAERVGGEGGAVDRQHEHRGGVADDVLVEGGGARRGAPVRRRDAAAMQQGVRSAGSVAVGARRRGRRRRGRRRSMRTAYDKRGPASAVMRDSTAAKACKGSGASTG